MGQIANQMALELFFKIKERIKEKRSKNKTIKTMVQRNRQLPVFKTKKSVFVRKKYDFLCLCYYKRRVEKNERKLS